MIRTSLKSIVLSVLNSTDRAVLMTNELATNGAPFPSDVEVNTTTSLGCITAIAVKSVATGPTQKAVSACTTPSPDRRFLR